MSIDGLNIKTLRREVTQTFFQGAYYNLLLGNKEHLGNEHLRLLLTNAIIFLNSSEIDLMKLGYRIVLRYANLFGQYEALYQVSLKRGFVPISKFIETRLARNGEYTESEFLSTFYGAYKDIFKKDNKYLSYGQKDLIEFAEKSSKDFAIVAPTSYGKSELIISRVLNTAQKKVCIVVPTKALLAQTKKRLFENAELAKAVKRIITHPEMYKGTESSLVAVLTQERLLRLLQKNSNFALDYVFIDEAHNLLRDDARAILLAQVLLILRKRNKSVRFNFFTPFVADSKSLVIPKAKYDLEFKTTNEYIKIEKFYLADFIDVKPLRVYDQFLDSFFTVENDSGTDEIAFIEKHKARKNIVYLNRPKDIELVALQFTRKRGRLNKEVQEIYDAISEFLHPEYNLLKCVKNGVVYHHGGMPDVIRLYVENLFSKDDYFDLIVTNSTLLEGVNIPAEKIFLLTVKIGARTFRKSQFKNLIGRICRFSEVFNPEKGDMNLLEPEIYLIKGEYEGRRINLDTFIKKVAKSDISISDEVGNILLQDDQGLDEVQKAKLKDSLEYLENIEPKTVDVKGIEYVKSDIGKLCYKNNVYDFNIKDNEDQLVSNLETVEDQKVSEPGDLIELIYRVFVQKISISDNNFGRLIHPPARRFYSMVLQWRVDGSSYKQLIGRLNSYWKGLSNPLIYVGNKWGEISFGPGYKKLLYVDISTKSESEKINLAIHRIKEEQDFVDNTLLKYVEILNDLQLIDKDLYDKVKYGSTDPNIICLLKNGFSIELSKCIMKPVYSPYVQIDLKNDEVFVESEIINAMEEENENRILIFEIGFHLAHP